MIFRIASMFPSITEGRDSSASSRKESPAFFAVPFHMASLSCRSCAVRYGASGSLSLPDSICEISRISSIRET